MRKKCTYSELLWSVFSRIWTEYREILRNSPYSVWIGENTDLISDKKQIVSIHTYTWLKQTFNGWLPWSRWICQDVVYVSKSSVPAKISQAKGKITLKVFIIITLLGVVRKKCYFFRNFRNNFHSRIFLES